MGMKPKQEGKWTHRYVLGVRNGVEPGMPKTRVIFEEKRPSGTPDARGTVIEIGVPSVPGVDDTRARVGQRQGPPAPAPPRCRRYIVGACVKNVLTNRCTYRVYEVVKDPGDITHADLVAAVKAAPYQVATLLRELLGGPYAVAGAIGIVAPERQE